MRAHIAMCVLCNREQTHTLCAIYRIIHNKVFYECLENIKKVFEYTIREFMLLNI